MYDRFNVIETFPIIVALLMNNRKLAFLLSVAEPAFSEGGHTSHSVIAGVMGDF